MTTLQPFTEDDRRAVAAQLEREPRGVVGVAWRCPCGDPGVIVTLPRLPGGSPFPTTYYLTCPVVASRIGTVEASGEMAAMTARLAADPDLAAHSLAVGPGVNPFGDEVVEMLGLSWSGEAEGTGTSEKENS